MTKRKKRLEQIQKGGIWGDARGNKIEVLKILGDKVKVKVLYIDDERFAKMEDREELIPISSFVAPTGFQCESRTGRPRKRL